MPEEFYFLRKYLAELAGARDWDCLQLPLYHTSPFLKARNYIHLRKLSCDPCDVFKKDLVYLFLGRAEYRDYKAPHLQHYRPIGFVINPKIIQALQAIKIFPFDTGALVENKYVPVFNEQDHITFREQYLLGEGLELKHAYALINILYESPCHYVLQKTRDNSQIDYDYKVSPEMDSIKRIHTQEYRDADGRKSAIEVQVDNDIDFTSENVMKIIAPCMALNKYKELHDLLNDLGMPPQIEPDNKAIMELHQGVQDCYSTIREESIKLSRSQCRGN
jgi:hypothetical protein